MKKKWTMGMMGGIVFFLIWILTGPFIHSEQSLSKERQKWLGIKSWNAAYTETYRSEKKFEVGQGAVMTVTLESRLMGSYSLYDKTGDDPSYLEWYGTGSGSYLMTKTSVWEAEGVTITEITRINSSGPIGTGNEADTEDQYGGNLVLDLYSGRYSFGFTGPHQEGESTLTRIIEGLPTDFSDLQGLPPVLREIFVPLGEQVEEWATYDGPLEDTTVMLVGDLMGLQLLPDMNMPADFELPSSVSPLSGSYLGKNTSFSWSIAPAGSGNPLYLGKCDPDWRPSAQEDNLVTISLEGNGWYGEKVDIRFTLYDFTHEKGTCMNSADTSEGPDLDFDHPQNDTLFKGQEYSGSGDGSVPKEIYIETKEPIKTASVTVVSWDWGAWGRLKAEVKHQGSENWIPVFTRGGEASITIPLDEENRENRIADSWEKQMASTDASTYRPGSRPGEDADDFPSNPYKGDGLTNYEEYRGFFVQGKHTSTNPGIKDLFMHVEDKRLAGSIRTFEEATRIRVHKIKPEEYVSNEERVVNPNRGEHSVVSQHGLYLMVSEENANFMGGAVNGDSETNNAPGWGDYGQLGNPGYNPADPEHSEHNGTPGWKSRIIIYINNILSNPDVSLDVTVIHELLHGLSVDHHGKGISLAFFMCDVELVTDPKDCDLDRISQEFKPMDILTGWRGPNSGDDSCVMSYPPADYYTMAGKKVARGADGKPIPFQPTPIIPTHICRTSKGNGQVGDAIFGNCWDQIRISDRVNR